MPQIAHPADVFAAIAEPRRRDVIAILSDGHEYAVNEIILRINLPQPAVSKHLAILRKAGVVSASTRGQHRMYRLNPEGLKPVREWMKTFERHWNHQIDQIKLRSERRALERLIRFEDTPEK
ncbi:ArsR/SmtB family transcription factor [Granulicella sibirica]|uniref:Transcriptional regulator, ArsR family n=1 Tax=Granulicella sibirica TaxID=2479048 RepID=A0A4Q0T966_9BACT|nr:metalloregulator ArsR/SmtB family transcription factor [Granulicella sibirica]RXH58151.1 Transcriptional regulator, ArsR family [Granulicella sibirica]